MGCVISTRASDRLNAVYSESHNESNRYLCRYDIQSTVPLETEQLSHRSPTNVIQTIPDNDDSSPKRVLMSHPAAHSFSIDTSRAKTNAQVVSLCAQKIGIKEYPEGRDDGKGCDIYWHNIVYHDMKSVVNSVNAKVNKFPGMTELSKKIALSRAITSMRKLFPDEYEFYPRSWFIPTQFDEFCEYCESREAINSDDIDHNQQAPVNWYIVKPDDGAQGSGIYLINSPSQLKDVTTKQLIQEYVSDPYLMSDLLKFDFRVYAVIKSINPLSIYVAREGMARFCTERYHRPTTSNSNNLYAHLTNYSLNKANDHYIHSNSLQDQLRGSKRLLSTVFRQMEVRGVKTKRLWHDIKLIIVKTILAMVPEIMLCYEHYFFDAPGPQCFQIMGFDILVTRQLNPILLEVNSAPSLTIEHSLPVNQEDDLENIEPQKIRSVVDEIIKIPLVMDTILLVLNIFDDVYNEPRISTGNVLSDVINHEKKPTDDNRLTLNTKKKSRLSEIFPCRYGQCSGHLLFLDKAVYLFMQFVNLKQTSFMTISGARTLIKKCNLTNVISTAELERKFIEVYYHFTGEQWTTGACGLTFHGFLTLIYEIAQLKFPLCDNLLGSVQRLFMYCDMSLQHYGVRSARLRRTQIDNDKENCVEIYLLPARLKERRLSRYQTRSRNDAGRKGRSRYSHSLPRNINLSSAAGKNMQSDATTETAKRSKVDRFVLPKIRPPFYV